MSTSFSPILDHPHRPFQPTNQHPIRRRPRKRQAPPVPHAPGPISPKYSDGTTVVEDVGLVGASASHKPNLLRVLVMNDKQQSEVNKGVYRTRPQNKVRAHAAGKRPAPSPPVQGEAGLSSPASNGAAPGDVRWSSQHRGVSNSRISPEYGCIRWSSSHFTSSRSKPWYKRRRKQPSAAPCSSAVRDCSSAELDQVAAQLKLEHLSTLPRRLGALQRLSRGVDCDEIADDIEWVYPSRLQSSDPRSHGRDARSKRRSNIRYLFLMGTWRRSRKEKNGGCKTSDVLSNSSNLDQGAHEPVNIQHKKFTTVSRQSNVNLQTDRSSLNENSTLPSTAQLPNEHRLADSRLESNSPAISQISANVPVVQKLTKDLPSRNPFDNNFNRGIKYPSEKNPFDSSSDDGEVDGANHVDQNITRKNKPVDRDNKTSFTKGHSAPGLDNYPDDQNPFQSDSDDDNNELKSSNIRELNTSEMRVPNIYENSPEYLEPIMSKSVSLTDSAKKDNPMSSDQSTNAMGASPDILTIRRARLAYFNKPSINGSTSPPPGKRTLSREAPSASGCQSRDSSLFTEARHPCLGRKLCNTRSRNDSKEREEKANTSHSLHNSEEQCERLSTKESGLINTEISKDNELLGKAHTSDCVKNNRNKAVTKPGAHNFLQDAPQFLIRENVIYRKVCCRQQSATNSQQQNLIFEKNSRDGGAPIKQSRAVEYFWKMLRSDLNTKKPLQPTVMKSSGKASHSDKVLVQLWVEDESSRAGPLQLMLDLTMTVDQLKFQMQEDYGLPAELQQWSLGRRCSVDTRHCTRTLQELGVHEYATVELFILPNTTVESASSQLETPQNQHVQSSATKAVQETITNLPRRDSSEEEFADAISGAEMSPTDEIPNIIMPNTESACLNAVNVSALSRDADIPPSLPPKTRKSLVSKYHYEPKQPENVSSFSCELRSVNAISNFSSAVSVRDSLTETNPLLVSKSVPLPIKSDEKENPHHNYHYKEVDKMIDQLEDRWNLKFMCGEKLNSLAPTNPRNGFNCKNDVEVSTDSSMCCGRAQEEKEIQNILQANVKFSIAKPTTFEKVTSLEGGKLSLLGDNRSLPMSKTQERDSTNILSQTPDDDIAEAKIVSDDEKYRLETQRKNFQNGKHEYLYSWHKKHFMMVAHGDASNDVNTALPLQSDSSVSLFDNLTADCKDNTGQNYPTETGKFVKSQNLAESNRNHKATKIAVENSQNIADMNYSDSNKNQLLPDQPSSLPDDCGSESMEIRVKRFTKRLNGVEQQFVDLEQAKVSWQSAEENANSDTKCNEQDDVNPNENNYYGLEVAKEQTDDNAIIKSEICRNVTTTPDRSVNSTSPSKRKELIDRHSNHKYFEPMLHARRPFPTSRLEYDQKDPRGLENISGSPSAQAELSVAAVPDVPDNDPRHVIVINEDPPMLAPNIEENIPSISDNCSKISATENEAKRQIYVSHVSASNILPEDEISEENSSTALQQVTQKDNGKCLSIMLGQADNSQVPSIETKDHHMIEDGQNQKIIPDVKGKAEHSNQSPERSVGAEKTINIKRNVTDKLGMSFSSVREKIAMFSNGYTNGASFRNTSAPHTFTGTGRQHIRQFVNSNTTELDSHLAALKQSLIGNTEEFECPVCLADTAIGEGAVLKECLHTFCRPCLASTVEHSSTAQVHCPFSCPQYSCTAVLQDSEIRALVTPSVFRAHVTRSLTQARASAADSFQCRSADCTGWCFLRQDSRVFRCPVCNKSNCLQCRAIHEGFTCEQYEENLAKEEDMDENSKKTHKFFQEMIGRGEALPCPVCQTLLLKKWGCDWLRCGMCRQEICWVSGQPRWGPKGKGDTSAGCRCGVNGKKCHPDCTYCH